MDVTLVNPFIDGALHVLKTMASTEATAGKPYIKRDRVAKGDVTGVIGLIGASRGSISVTFTEECILDIVSKMFGEEMTELNEEIRDAVGEISNMISGYARRILDGSGKSLQAAIPTVVMGKNHTLSHMTIRPIIAIPFTTDHGSFTIEVCFED